MKPSTPSTKSSLSNSKTKKNSKDKEKKKSQGANIEVNNHNTPEKGSPSKEPNTRLYAGIDSELLFHYAEQTTVEHLSEEITNTLTEDINYKLRYIINDALMKARISGRNAINCSDIEETFENLNIDKVYGAPSHPNWISFGEPNFYCLDDKLVNLVELAEEDNAYCQYSDIVLTAKWFPEQEMSKALKNYFSTMCQMIVNNDFSIRRTALINISENSRIGPIIEWFYNFGYILLSKDITYDCLTLRALDLIRVLENSQTCRIFVSEKLLKLLVRLILQRLLKPTTANDLLKPMCSTLALLSLRDPLRQFVILKILQKLDEVFANYALSILTTANCLGVDALQAIVLPNLGLFLSKTLEKRQLPFTYSILESYNILRRESLVDSTVYESFYEYFGDAMITFDGSAHLQDKGARRDVNFAHVKGALLRRRRKIRPKQKPIVVPIEEVFEMPPENSKVRKKMSDQKWDRPLCNNTQITVGQTALLLPVFQRRGRTHPRCHDHTLIWYNL